MIRYERNINPATVIIAATLLLLSTIALVSRIEKLNTDQEWDLLIFTQHWPNTVCMEWEEEKPNATCAFPKQKGHWTIHGIWPTKKGTIGPLFCNKSMHFNDTALNDIREDLNEYWTDIEIGSGHKTDSFWKHEWLKHGTCAVSIPNLDSETKYFKQALSWYKDYNMLDVLGLSNIRPQKGMSVGYHVEELSNAVVTAIGRNPYIHCATDKKTGIPFLSEVRICFTKEFVLVDCDGVKTEKSLRISNYKSVLTNCSPKKQIVYPKDVPPQSRQTAPVEPEHFLVNLYRTLLFINWFTS